MRSQVSKDMNVLACFTVTGGLRTIVSTGHFNLSIIICLRDKLLSLLHAISNLGLVGLKKTFAYSRPSILVFI